MGRDAAASGIALGDASGVALAAVQGLHELVLHQRGLIDALKSENAALHLRLERIEAALSAMID